MNGICALGIDPGCTGFLLARWEPPARKAVLARAFTADMGSAPFLLEMLLRSEYGMAIGAAQIEAFDSRRRSRMMRGVSAAAMHQLIADLSAALLRMSIPYQVRNAGMVKPWATAGNRLKAAGLDIVLRGMPDHAASAGWHCLYTACRDLGLPDPLSRMRST